MGLLLKREITTAGQGKAEPLDHHDVPGPWKALVCLSMDWYRGAACELLAFPVLILPSLEET